MKEAGVEKVFIATDGVDGERDELKEEFGDSVYFYNPTPEEEKKFKKGGVAIIDQDGISNILWFSSEAMSEISLDATYRISVWTETGLL